MRLPLRTQTKYRLIRRCLEERGNVLSVQGLCETACVSRSGYYRWRSQESARQVRELQDAADFDAIRRAYQYRGYSKGARGIHMRLLHETPAKRMNVKKIRRLMRKYGLKCPIRKANPYRRMAKAMATSRKAPNLLQRQFEAYGPRGALLTDITYLNYPGGRCYLSVILDAYTKQVLAYRVSESLAVDFVLETVRALLKEHGGELRTEVLLHSDQGCHYTSTGFIEILRSSELRQSMSRRGNCWDNAPQESFFGHMKDEIALTLCESYGEVERLVEDWIDYYNTERYQWDLAKLSPDEYWEYTQTGEYPLPESDDRSPSTRQG